MMTEILLSIIIPCFNVDKYIKACVESLYKGIDDIKDLNYFEVILVDDGSSDGTNAICQALQAKYNNLRIFKQNNQGVSVARNLGMNICKGKFIWFIDADDCVNSGSVVTLLRIVEKNIDIDGIVFGFNIHSENGSIETVPPLGEKLKECSMESYIDSPEIIERYVCNVIGYSQHNLDNLFAGRRIVEYKGIMHDAVWHFLLNRKLIEEKHLFFNPLIRLREDSIFILEYMVHVKKILLIPDLLYHYYIRNTGNMVRLINDTSFMLNNKLALLKERSRLREIYLKKHKIDLFPYYMGSLVLSSLEIMVKGSMCSYKRGLQAIKYVRNPFVRKAIQNTNIQKAPWKYKLPIVFLKYRCYYFLVFLLYIAQKLGVKSPV